MGLFPLCKHRYCIYINIACIKILYMTSLLTNFHICVYCITCILLFNFLFYFLSLAYCIRILAFVLEYIACKISLHVTWTHMWHEFLNYILCVGLNEKKKKKIQIWTDLKFKSIVLDSVNYNFQFIIFTNLDFDM